MSTLKDNLIVCLQTPGCEGVMGLPLLIEGPPGGAKTAIIRQLGKALNLHCETILLSVREPADVAGVQIMLKDGSVQIAPPNWVKKLISEQEAILFLDELSCTQPATQAAALRIVAERVVGDTPLHPNTRVIAAMNPVDQAAGGYDIAPSLANRFIHQTIKGPVMSEWTDWLLGAAKPLEAKKISEGQWKNALAKTKGIFLAFLNKRPNLLGPNVPEDLEKASRAWPSPRSWELAIRAYAGAQSLSIDPQMLVAGAVGEGAAAEFNQYAYYRDLPDPSDLINDKVTFTPDPSRLDQTLAVLTSLAAYSIQDHPTAPKTWSLISKYSAKSKDIAVPAVRALINAELYMSPQATKTLAALLPLLKEAKISFSRDINL